MLVELQLISYLWLWVIKDKNISRNNGNIPIRDWDWIKWYENFQDLWEEDKTNKIDAWRNLRDNFKEISVYFEQILHKWYISINNQHLKTNIAENSHKPVSF